MNDSWLDRNRNVVFIALALLAAVGAAVFYVRQPSQEPIAIIPAQETATPAPTATPLPPPTFTPAPVRIYITGAVQNSDVYFLPAGSIVKDVIEAAGGFAPNANRDGINLALELQDQQQIHVPIEGEDNPPPPIQGGSDNPKANESQQSPGQVQPASDGVINLNTATLDQLDTLPGIGPAIAKRIIEYRDSIGGFTTVDQITQVSGIGEATFAKIKEQITIE